MVYIRAHHILCMMQFVGYGYSEEFTENMKDIIGMLKDSEVIIIDNFDSICSSCPNKAYDICLLDSDIVSLDKKVLDLLNIPTNKPIFLKDFFDTIKENLSKENFEYICSSCSWYKKGVCSYEKLNFSIF